jgi:uncharacterized protein (UPF0264 family)
MRLLVSVRDAIEARSALAGGAEWIDIKEPHRGALGAADPQVWREVREAVGDAAPVSAALGELVEEGRGELAKLTSGLGYVKIGLAGASPIDWRSRWRELLKKLPMGVKHVAVCYVDWRESQAPCPSDVVAFAADHSAAAVLFDTFDKRSGKLFVHLSAVELDLLARRCRACELSIALAGSIDADDLKSVAALAPEIVAVRGAVCRPDRRGAVDASLVRRFQERLARERRRATAEHDEKNRLRFA